MEFERRTLAALAVLILHTAAIGFFFWEPRHKSPPPKEIVVSLALLPLRPAIPPPPPLPEPPEVRSRRVITIPLPPLSIPVPIATESAAPSITALAPVPEQVPINKPAEPAISHPLIGPAASDYASRLAAALARVKRYPLQARNAHEEGTVELLFELERSGRVLDWRIARSSGHPTLDAQVARMVAAAAPFPPFPPSMPQARESFLVPIEFSLNAGPT